MGGSPQANPATKLKLDKYIQKVLDPETTFDIVAGQTRVMLLKGVPFRIQAGDERYLALVFRTSEGVVTRQMNPGRRRRLGYGDIITHHHVPLGRKPVSGIS